MGFLARLSEKGLSLRNLALASILAFIALPIAPAGAATFTVNSGADLVDDTTGNGSCSTGTPTGGPCTLRAAVQESNAFAGADTVNLPAGPFALSLPGAGEQASATGDLDVTESLALHGVGSGTGGTIIQGATAPSERILETLGANTDVTLSGLRLTGSTDPNTVSGIVGNGLSLTLSGVVITGNSGDGIVQQFGPGGANPFFTMVDSTVTGNTSTGSVLEIGSNGIGRASFSDSSISGNTLNGAGGFPAILTLDNGTNDSRVTITRATFSGNTATGDEGVIDFDPSGAASAAGDHLSITDSVFSNNQLAGGNGAILFDPSATGTTTPMSLSLTRTRFLNNVASPSGSGGAIEFAPSGSSSASLTARDSTFQGNVAGTGSGGAIDFGGPAGSALTISGSTFAGNRAGNTGGSGSRGGAISFGPADGSTLAITNSTLSGNTAPGMTAQGGALYFSGAHTGTLTNATVADNGIGQNPGGGGGISLNSGALTVRNTILSGNNNGGAVSDCFRNTGSTVTSGGGNIEGATTCSFNATGDRQSTNPLIGPLASNGGPTQTRALLTGSPALDRALAAFCPSSDQRGVARPQGPACDVGAFEAEVKAPGQTGLPAPVLGKSVNVFPLKGKVFISEPAGSARLSASVPGLKGKRFVLLTRARQIAVKSFLDTRKGTVRLVSARDTKGATQSGEFSAGVFQALQSGKASAKGLTELRLKGSSFKRCKRRRARRSEVRAGRLSHRRVRRLRSKATGRFRTRGRYSAATVRGTEWSTADRCDGTLTTVKSGRVAVRDFRRKKTIVVKRGKKYLARAPG